MMDTFVQSKAKTVPRVWTLVLSKGRVQLLRDPKDYDVEDAEEKGTAC